jgi:hypothetical protein
VRRTTSICRYTIVQVGTRIAPNTQPTMFIAELPVKLGYFFPNTRHKRLTTSKARFVHPREMGDLEGSASRPSSDESLSISETIVDPYI